MVPEAFTIEALPAILILSGFIIVMIKIFILNSIPSKKEREKNSDLAKSTMEVH